MGIVGALTQGRLSSGLMSLAAANESRRWTAASTGSQDGLPLR